MPDFKNYSPDQLTVTFGGLKIGGFAEGTFIQVARNEDSYETVVGSQGDVTRVKKLNRSGTIIVTLQQSSPSNDLLSAELAADEAEGAVNAGLGEAMVKDANGTTVINSDNSWVQKYADVTFSNGLEGREWTIACADLQMVVGGSLV